MLFAKLAGVKRTLIYRFASPWRADMSCDGGEWIATFEGGVSISVIHIVDPDLWEAAAG